MDPRPRALRFVGIAAMALGLGGALTTAASLEALRRPAPAPVRKADRERPTMADVEEALRAAPTRVMRRWRVRTLPFDSANLVLCGILFVSAAGAMRLRPFWRRTLFQALVAKAAFTVPATIVHVLVARAASAAQAPVLPLLLRAMKTSANADVTRDVARASEAVGLVIAVGWAVLQIAFYLGAAAYLRRPAVVALYEPPASPAS